ncbi:MAG: histidine kinase dimerization/phospho-acceptor domain-containing protein, partial [Tistlia sp.]
MRFPYVRSLSAQTLVVLFAGLVVSHFIGMAIYSLDRREAVMTDEAVDVAERVVSVVQLLRTLPVEWREEIVRGFDSRTFGVALAAVPPGPQSENRKEVLAAEVRRYLRQHLGLASDDSIRLRFRRATDPSVQPVAGAGAEPQGEPLGESGWRRVLERLGGGDRYDRLEISARLDDGQWLNFHGALPRVGELWPGLAGAYILSVALAVGALTTWLVARVTAPLSAFAGAAERFGRNIRAEPLPETGPTEVVQASRALNEMQERLRRLVENRTQMLAAISHDLRTPVTLLRLRAELMAEGDERTKVLDTLDEMEAMIASVLDFAKGTFHDEPQRQVDLSALVASLCDDMADAGADVVLAP